MALVGLIRVATVARMLGVHPRTAARWLDIAGVHVAAQPVLGHGRIGGAAPLYVSLDGAVSLVDTLLPRKVERLASARLRQAAAREARKLEESTRNLQHAVGGTGLEAPTPKQPL